MFEQSDCLLYGTYGGCEVRGQAVRSMVGPAVRSMLGHASIRQS